MVPGGFSWFSWFQVESTLKLYSGPTIQSRSSRSKFQGVMTIIFIRVINIVLIRVKISLSSGKLNIFLNRMIIISGIGEERRVL